VFGHELAGDVVAAGEAVTKFWVGQRVVAANSAPCEQCYFCRRGLQNLCEDLLFNNGAYAEYIRIPARIVERNTYAIPPHVGYQDAALLEPLACVVRGFEETNPHPGDTIAIIGLGPIGLMFVKLAKLYGCRVIAVGRRKTQMDRAALLGADDLIVGSDEANPVRAIRDLTRGLGADVAIEAVGQPLTWEWAVNMVRRGGTVNFFGGCPNDSTVNLDTALLHYSEITCKASFHHTPAYIRKALDLITHGHITASFFVNNQEPLANLLEVMRHLMSHNGHLKTAIVP
jgi:L-iditol 2-dehydrogenase